MTKKNNSTIATTDSLKQTADNANAKDDEPIFTEEERLRMWQLIFDFYGGRGRDEDE